MKIIPPKPIKGEIRLKLQDGISIEKIYDGHKWVNYLSDDAIRIIKEMIGEVR